MTVRRHVIHENGRRGLVIDREYPPCPVPLGSLSKSGDEPNGWAADAYWLTNIQLTDFGGKLNF